MSCPFCNKEILNAVFNESNDLLAVYNIAPVFPGHSLIIPRMHLERFNDLPTSILKELMPFTQQVIEQLSKVFQARDFDIAIQDGFWAGQTINHFHLHIIPRYENDLPEPGDWYPKFEKNNKKIIDSASRHRHSVQEISNIVHKLKIS